MFQISLLANVTKSYSVIKKYYALDLILVVSGIIPIGNNSTNKTVLTNLMAEIWE